MNRALELLLQLREKPVAQFLEIFEAQHHLDPGVRRFAVDGLVDNLDDNIGELLRGEHVGDLRGDDFVQKFLNLFLQGKQRVARSLLQGRARGLLFLPDLLFGVQ